MRFKLKLWILYLWLVNIKPPIKVFQICLQAKYACQSTISEVSRERVLDPCCNHIGSTWSSCSSGPHYRQQFVPHHSHGRWYSWWLDFTLQIYNATQADAGLYTFQVSTCSWCLTWCAILNEYGVGTYTVRWH